MEFHLLPIVILISLSVVVIDATVTLPPDVYWKEVSHDTAMPRALQHLLPEAHAGVAEEAVDVGVGSGGVGVSVGTGHGGGVSVGAGIGGSKHLWWWKYPHHPWNWPFAYHYNATQDQLRGDPSVALFFQEKDLQPCKKMNLHFTKTASGAKFLPRHVSETIPFSSNEFSNILNWFSVDPESAAALEMKKTIDECEEPAMEGEDKYCATSLEGMVDYATSKLGNNNVKVIATEVSEEDSPQQEFTILPGITKMEGGKTVVCHGQNYPYAVFNCHASRTAKAYLVPMIGADRNKVEAAAVCHTDTSKWNPGHLAFQVLKVKPGTVPICHFLPEGHFVWTSKSRFPDIKAGTTAPTAEAMPGFVSLE